MSKLYVVGIGPGSAAGMTLQADDTLKRCEVIVGYTVYVDLLRARYPHKMYLTTGMTREAERCRMALGEAAAGRETALVCSGDSGIYGMAALTYELRGACAEPEIEVVPGLTAAVSGGALLGAPLTCDFAVISLSDRLTPWLLIEKRLEMAAQADLTIVLYNPAGRSRPDHLKKACDILLRTLPADRLCGICRNIGREGETYCLTSLERLRETPVDMFCTVFIGNDTTKAIGGKMIAPRGYRDV